MEIPCGSKNLSKSLFLEWFFPNISIFVLCNFCKKFENSKWPPFWVRQNFLKIGMATLQSYPMGQIFRRNCSILHGFRDISIFVKNSKIQNGCQFWRDKFFLKIGMATLQRYPVGQKFCQKSCTVFEI